MVMFFVEKKIFISYSLKPPLYTGKISVVVSRALLIGLFLHCIFAIYIYGQEDIFPRSLTIIQVNDIFQLDIGTQTNSLFQDLMARLVNSPFFVIMALIVLTTIILELVFGGFKGTNLKYKFLKDFQNSIEGNYYDNFNVIHYNDLPKYDFRLVEE